MTQLEHLKAELKENIKECERFEKNAAKRGAYTDAIQLQGMIAAYKKIALKLDRIFK